jgi:endoglucanase
MEVKMKDKNRKSGFIIIVLISVFLAFGSVSAFSQSCGDVNNSGSVDIVDALLIAQEYVGLQPSPFYASAADTNGDGSIDIIDALLVAQYYVGLVSTLSCPTQTTAPTETPEITGAPTPGPTGVPGPGPVYSVSGGSIRKDGAQISLYGLNWFGMETGDHVLHGLWTNRQLDDFLSDFVSKGFNALRLPLSPEVIHSGYAITSGPYSGADCDALCDQDGRTALEYTLGRMDAAGMYALLDFHTCNPGNLGSGLPGTPTGCSGYSLSSWLGDLRELASLSITYTNVVGIDLCNEPHALSYSEWADLCSQGGQAVLSVNPNVTIWVEGVGNNSATGGYPANWGQNLYEAGSIAGIPDDRLVFSPHSYGPSVAMMDYFNDSNFPNNMPGIWDTLFGHLINKGFTVIVGEYGGQYTGSDKTWQDAFINYLINRNIRSSFYWCVNPNSGDTGGIYGDDWQTWNTAKLSLLQRLMN